MNATDEVEVVVKAEVLGEAELLHEHNVVGIKVGEVVLDGEVKHPPNPLLARKDDTGEEQELLERLANQPLRLVVGSF